MTQTSRIALRANLEVLASTGEDVRHGAVALAGAVSEAMGGALSTLITGGSDSVTTIGLGKEVTRH